MTTPISTESPGREPLVPRHVAFLGWVFVSGLAFLSAHRTILWLLARDRSVAIPPGVLLRALGMGVRFDAAVSAYLLVAPLLVLSALRAAGRRGSILERIVTWMIGAGYASVFLVTSADMPWFLHFGSRISVAALGWADTPRFLLDQAVGDPGNWPYALLFLGTTAVFGFVLRRLARRHLETGAGERPSGGTRGAAALSIGSIAALALLLVAARGRIAQSSPLRTGTAFFSPYPLANQLGLNPAFTFWDSVLEERGDRAGRVPLMPQDLAIEAARRLLGITAERSFASPLARRVEPVGNPSELNVVIVLMEGMAAGYLSRNGGSGLTPRLDEIAARGWSFDRIYAAGLHTYAGVYATLFSLPTLPGEHPMKGARALQSYGGIARVLGERGYRTAFLCPHDAQIDDMGGFLANNGYGRVLDLADWPRELVQPNLRVPDHALFDLALPVLRGLGSGGNPFLAAILTVSNHPRFYLPEGIPFRPRSADAELRMVEYADWSIGRFLDAAAREPWFERTLFVFLADHGAPLRGAAGAPPERHHVPLVFYAPAVLGPPRAIGAIGGQVDVGPTVLGLLGGRWVNNTLGIDLLRERRPAIYFSDDDAITVFDGDTCLVRRRDGAETVTGAARGAGESASWLEEYALSMLESAHAIVERNLAGPDASRAAR